YMRRFYLAYSDRLPQISQTPSGKLPAFGISQTVSGELTVVEGNQRMPFSLSWSHYVFLLGVKNLSERSFYEIEASNQNWTLRELRRQFDAGLYERLALSRD